VSDVQEPSHELLEPLRALQRALRDAVLATCRAEPLEALSEVADDAEGDTIYAIDKVSEETLLRELEPHAERFGGFVLVAEGLTQGITCLPRRRPENECRYRVIVDPIDGTRGLMYQKRPAWVLTGVAPNRGENTRLSQIELALQTEIPLNKQHLADELWAVRGQGTRAERVDLITGDRKRLELRPSRARNILHGYASVSRFFPGARDELAAIDEEIVRGLIGIPVAGKARCFEDQYASTGGQLYELCAGHDRYVADLRPLLAPLLRARGLPLALCCHPYDVCTALIAEELGVVIRDPLGGVFDAPFDVGADVAWVGYANAELCLRIQPLLIAALKRRGLLGSGP
jgi:fructose-1,6-bisphosphatase/inositol monophosphatase family enzyme